MILVLFNMCILFHWKSFMWYYPSGNNAINHQTPSSCAHVERSQSCICPNCHVLVPRCNWRFLGLWKPCKCTHDNSFLSLITSLWVNMRIGLRFPLIQSTNVVMLDQHLFQKLKLQGNGLIKLCNTMPPLLSRLPPVEQIFLQREKWNAKGRSKMKTRKKCE